MAKGKYRRKGKKEGKTPKPCEDKHHIFYMKRNWRRGALEKLRRHEYCAVYIPKRTLHKYIHDHLANIPAPSQLAAKEALEQLQTLNFKGYLHPYDPIEKRLNLLAALFDCSAQPTADALREQLSVVREFKRKPP